MEDNLSIYPFVSVGVRLSNVTRIAHEYQVDENRPYYVKGAFSENLSLPALVFRCNKYKDKGQTKLKRLG